MLAKFAEDDRIEQMNAQRRRMKQQEHKRAVESLIEERRRQHEMDKVAYFAQSIFLCEIIIYQIIHCIMFEAFAFIDMEN